MPNFIFPAVVIDSLLIKKDVRFVSVCIIFISP